MRFTYSSGYRPLDGYTIKRGIGQGGFGEVYFAVSDGGKEVALKMIRNNLEVELRGMRQCLNFKHPNLIQLYDIRQDVQGNFWVVMEYVSGESLNGILNRHSDGVPRELAQQWFQGLADAVSYLHDHGVVHRDLKPGNIFIENGTIKVGDYGLCKCVSGSQRSAQTQSVGTVHYMAPEISTGNYDKQIDVYAAGVVLYEMLTGRVPFEGESAGEILMKHLTAAPDLSRVPGPFVAVVSKALAKNPAQRHRSMQELAKEVVAVGAPKPEPKPQPSQPVETVAIPAAPLLSSASPSKPLYKVKQLPVSQPGLPSATAAVAPTRTRLAELCKGMLISALLAGLFTLLWSAVLRPESMAIVGRYYFLSVACCWAVLIPAKLWTRRASESLARRGALMCLGLCIGFLALWLDGYDLSGLLVSQAHAQSPGVDHAVNHFDPTHPPTASTSQLLPIFACYLSYFALAMFGIRWWQLADKRRAKRFSLYPVVAAAVLGLLLLLIWPSPQYGVRSDHVIFGHYALGVVTLVMTAVIIQIVTPWQRSGAPAQRKLRLPRA